MGWGKVAKQVKQTLASKPVVAATGMTFRYAGTTTQVPTGSTWYAQQTTAEIVVAWVNPAKTGYKSSLLGRSGTSYTAGTGGYAYKFWK